MQSQGQTPFDTPQPNSGSKEELGWAAKNYIAYTGAFYLDESGSEPMLRHHVMLCDLPNWVGDTQRRNVSLHGDSLTLSLDYYIELGGVKRRPVLEWRKMTDLSKVSKSLSSEFVLQGAKSCYPLG